MSEFAGEEKRTCAALGRVKMTRMHLWGTYWTGVLSLPLEAKSSSSERNNVVWEPQL